ncbi:hypothetical protein [uncultured Duncaniella sp.]|uniref:hypothetical protein n=1 Tax=uncultured Duncaniella sp. TaxID=2768039 RepID=UPI0025A93FEC|nr:hypothetical protein [uncultured Duncaniella sp.]
METILERIIRITGCKPIECQCAKCREQCRTPCLGTPEDILRLLQAGYKKQFAPTLWGVGVMLGHIPYLIPMIQAKRENGYCIFYREGLCELHSLGLKPTEGKLSHHIIVKESMRFGTSLSWNVAKEWLDERNAKIVIEIIRIMTE